jgi:hypothetical protein
MTMINVILIVRIFACGITPRELLLSELRQVSVSQSSRIVPGTEAATRGTDLGKTFACTAHIIREATNSVSHTLVPGKTPGSDPRGRKILIFHAVF